MNTKKQGVSEDQRTRILDLRRRHSFREVSQLTGIALGTIKTICSRSGAFRDNEIHRALFCLPPIQLSTEQRPAMQALPEQQRVTGDRDVDALLWLREVIGTGHPNHIATAMEAAKRLKAPLKDLELRYRDWLRAAHPNNMFAALSSFDLGNLEGLAKSSVEKLRKQTEARSRFGDRIFSLTDAEVFCESALAGLEPIDGFDLNKSEVAARFKARPEQMPNTLSDCIHELQYWTDLYWLRNASAQYAGDPCQEASARDWFVFELLAQIRPRHKDESKAVMRYLSISGRGDHRQDCDRIIDNLLG